MIGTETLRQMRRAEALEAELARLKSPLPRYRHKKRGTEYVLIGFGRMQSGNWIGDVMVNGEYTRKTVDMHEVAIYRSVDDGSLWVRPREEFEDGRFELITEAVT